MTDRSAEQILDESFLDVRAKLIEVAATLDRIQRASADGGGLADDTRRQKLDAAIRVLLESTPDRSAKLQQLFSRLYDSHWREEMNL